MENVIEIRLEWNLFEKDGITREEFDNIVAYYFNSYNNAIQYIKEIGLWSNSIKKVIITNEYYKDVQKQANDWGFTVQFAKHKEYLGISKCLFNRNINDPQYYIFFPAMFTPQNDQIWRCAVFQQLVFPFCEESFTSEFYRWGEYPSSFNLYDYLKYAIATWCPAIRVSMLLKQHIDVDANTLTSEELFNFFARRLKKHLFDYNCDGDNSERVGIFWHEFFTTFTNFILRSLQAKISTENLHFKDQKLTELVDLLFEEIFYLDKSLDKGNTYTLENLISKTLDLFRHFNIEISDYNTGDSFYVNLPKNPKEYFKGVLVETEPRIVCFMDILGFSEMINNYEEDETSTLLQDIQKAFTQALTILKGHTEHSPNKEQLEFLEHKTFSDNICISLPYFNTEIDFLSNLNLIITFIRGLQYSLMSFGFFTRGGIAMGSYYSDDNMIFSKAMIDAYYLESNKAKYPRIVIDDKIVEKIRCYEMKAIQYYGLDKAILFERNVAIVNPFELLEGTRQIMKNMFSVSKMEEDSDDTFLPLLNSFLSTLENSLIKQLDSATEADNDALEKIYDIVKEKLLFYKPNKKTFIKYLWLQMLIEWVKDKTKVKRFSYLSTNTMLA